ncbi:MAG: glycosyltransferase family 4 protein [Geminicoccaceae bacterium]
MDELTRAGRNVVLLLPSDCERHTGGYVWESRVAQELRELGWVVDERELPPGFPHPSHAARSGSVRVLAGFPDGALILSESYATSVIPELLAAEAHRLRLVTVVHHPLADETGLTSQERARLFASERAALRCLRHVVVPSRETGSRLERRYGVPASRLTLAYPGTDPAPLARGSAGQEATLLAVGAVMPRKDQPALIEALGTLRDLRWRLRVVGSLVRFPDTVREVRARAAALDIADRVELTGEVDAPTLARWRDGSDLQVSASRHEGYGMALAEGIACGLPAVAVAGGAVAEWLTADAALLVPPGDPAALALALRRAIADRALRQRLRAGAIDLRRTLPTWRSAALATERALLRALATPSPMTQALAGA